MSSHPIFSLKSPWENNHNTNWIATSMSLSRNIDKIQFPNKLDSKASKEIASVIAKELTKGNYLHNGYKFPANKTTRTEKEYLSEHFLIDQDFNQLNDAESFVIDDTGLFLALLNVGDHLKFSLLNCDCEIEKAGEHLAELERKFEEKLAFAFSQKFGFLTADPTISGTGLVVSIFLQLPALIHTKSIEKVLQKQEEDFIVIRSMQGDPKAMLGDILVVQNKYTAGVSESTIIAKLRQYSMRLLLEENGAKKEIMVTQNNAIKDKISRAFGTVKNCYQIEVTETLNNLSLVKLGIELGWINGLTIPEINTLFFQCRRAHLVSQFSEKISKEDLPLKRAVFIKAALQNAALDIT